MERTLILSVCVSLLIVAPWGCKKTEDGGDTLAIDAGKSSPDAEVPPTECEVLGLQSRDFVDAKHDKSMYATAANLIIPTTEGNWDLKANWSGCDVYLFIQDVPAQATGWPVPLWDRDVAALINRSPKNVHYFFLSTAYTDEMIGSALANLKTQVDAALAALSEDDQAWWNQRVHYVTASAKYVGGWLGEINAAPGWGAAIDRHQRVRYIGSYADSTRYDEGRGWFAPNLSMAANEAVYYNFEAERQERLDAQDATVVSVFPGDPVSGDGFVEVELPDAETMATFDTLEFDLYLGCVGEGEFGTCPAWDYLVYLFVCDQEDPENCSTQIGRWITTYHREGRWVHDVSAMLPLLAEGGTRKFRFQTQQTYEIKLDFRLSNQGKTARPEEVTYLYSGGSYNGSYNESHAPMTVNIPADAVKVELATVISGHGQVEPGNCAEFCNTTHHFSVNGTENVLSLEKAGTADDCMNKAAEGTVPNQYGTWWYGRSGWCPGKEVPMVMTDITAQVTLGGETTFEYSSLRNGKQYISGGANIRLSSWVVVSR